MNKNIILVLGLLLVLNSCISDNVEQPVVIKPDSYAYGFSSELFDGVEYIPLSSRGSQDYLFGVQRVLMNENYVFVLQDNDTERSIFKFDKEGNFIKALRGLDNFEKKFYAVTDFDLFKDKIVLTDSYTQEISFFDQDFKFIESVSVAEGVGGVQNIEFLSSNTIIIRPDLESAPVSSILKSNLEEILNPEIIDGFFGVKGTPAEKMRVSLYETFHHSSEEDKILYVDFFNNNIFEIGLNSVEEKYKILLDDDLWVNEQELVDMNSMDMDEQFELLSKIDKADFVSSVYEKDSYLMLSFMKVRKRYFVIFNKETSKTESIILDFNKTSPSVVDGSPPLKYFLGFTNEGSLVFFHRAEEFKQYAESLRNEDSINLSEGQKYFLATDDRVDEYCNIVLAILKPDDL